MVPATSEDDGALVFENGVDEGGFAGIRFADHGDLESVLGGFLFFFACFLGERFEALVDEVEKLWGVSSMCSGDGEACTEAEAGELAGAAVDFLDVRFVQNEADAIAGAAEMFGDGLIDGGDSFPGIDQEENDLGGLHGDVRTCGDGIGELDICIGSDAAGIDQLAWSGRQWAGGRDAVAGDAGLVVDDGDLPGREAVEKGGFSDVGAADESDAWFMTWVRHGLVPGVGGCLPRM